MFRVAVREIEAWLLADREGIADFLGVRLNSITYHPEDLDDPKQELINLALTGRKSIKEELVPPQSSTATIGPGYNQELTKYIQSCWNTEKARECSESLSLTIEKIDNL